MNDFGLDLLDRTNVRRFDGITVPDCCEWSRGARN